MKKRLHFSQNLIPLILNGTKTTTWRYQDDKDLKPGDTLELLSPNEEKFAEAKIISTNESLLGSFTKEDKKGHEKFKSEEEMYQTYSKYYSITAHKKTKVKVIHFTLLNST